MKSGRKPTPTALKLVRGNPGKRAINRNEPKPPPIAPSRPEWLSAEAKHEWSRLVSKLGRLGLLTEIDRAALAAYCTAWAHMVEAERRIRDSSPVGPYWTILMRSMQQVRAFAAEFGLTPSSRSRLSLAEPKTEDDFEDLLAEGSR